MLVIVSSVFILTSSPLVALSITRYAVYDFFISRRFNNILLLSHTVYLQLSMINCSGVNFLVYVLRSSRFRQELAKFLCFGFLKPGKQAGVRKGEGVSVSTVTTGTLDAYSSGTL